MLSFGITILHMGLQTLSSEFQKYSREVSLQKLTTRKDAKELNGRIRWKKCKSTQKLNIYTY